MITYEFGLFVQENMMSINYWEGPIGDLTAFIIHGCDEKKVLDTLNLKGIPVGVTTNARFDPINISIIFPPVDTSGKSIRIQEIRDVLNSL